MKFIGHLDTMRYFQKAMRRAGVDIVYTEGFSPHQKMSFAAPLGVGILSEGEYMDIEVHSVPSGRSLLESLNQAMVEGMEVVSCKLLPEGSGKAMALVAAADYALRFRQGYEPESFEAFADAFSAFISRPELPVTKSTKKGERTLDLKPLIYHASIQGQTILLSLCTGSTDNVKPELVMETFYRSQDKEMPEFAFEITRLEIYADIGINGERKLVSLDELGQDIE